MKAPNGVAQTPDFSKSAALLVLTPQKPQTCKKRRSALLLLYRLALEKGTPGARYHAVAGEGVTVREIAEVIARGLKVPVVSMASEKAAKHFGWLAPLAGLDLPASSAQTRKELGWNPAGPSLLTDLENMRYS
jgi:nucleoside-diphosphate-sugar epimerase